MTAKKYKMDSIVPKPILHHEDLQPRLGPLRPRHVEKLMDSYRNGNKVPPMGVAKVNGQRYYLIDGHHRYEALKQLGLLNDPIDVQVCNVRNVAEARAEALKANSHPSLKYTQAERQAAFDRIVAERQYEYEYDDGFGLKVTVRKSAQNMVDEFGIYARSTWAAKMKELEIPLSDEDKAPWRCGHDYDDEQEEAQANEESSCALYAFLEALKDASRYVPAITDSSHINTAKAALQALLHEIDPQPTQSPVSRLEI
jgi:ParB-like chromosome segregation protein Spo0J